MQEIKDAYDDNASYDEDSSVAKAKIFVTACRLLLRKIPKRSVHGGRGGEEIEIQPDLIQREMDIAKAYITANQDSGRVKFSSFGSFR